MFSVIVQEPDQAISPHVSCEARCGFLVRRPWGLVVAPSGDAPALWPGFAEAVAAADAYRSKRFRYWRTVVTFRIADQNGRLLSGAESLVSMLVGPGDGITRTKCHSRHSDSLAAEHAQC